MPKRIPRIRILIALAAVAVMLVSLLALQIIIKRHSRSQRENTLRTIKDWATAWEIYYVNARTYLPLNKEIGQGGWDNITTDQLIDMFAEAGIDSKYTSRLSPKDGWGWSIQFAVSEKEDQTEYSIRSPGKDGKWDKEQYKPNTPTRLYDNDIVLSNGQFVQYPSTCPSSQPFPFEDETWAWPLLKAKPPAEK